MDIRNPVFTADGRIDCEVNLPGIGWAPFTASSEDVEALGREVFADALAMGPAPYVVPAPAPEPVPASASTLQVKLALYQLGFLPEVEAFIASSGFVEQLAWREAGQFYRDSPMLLAGAELMLWPPDRLDQIFRLAATIRV